MFPGHASHENVDPRRSIDIVTAPPPKFSPYPYPQSHSQSSRTHPPHSQPHSHQLPFHHPSPGVEDLHGDEAIQPTVHELQVVPRDKQSRSNSLSHAVPRHAHSASPSPSTFSRSVRRERAAGSESDSDDGGRRSSRPHHREPSSLSRWWLLAILSMIAFVLFIQVRHPGSISHTAHQYRRWLTAPSAQVQTQTPEKDPVVVTTTISTDMSSIEDITLLRTKYHELQQALAVQTAKLEAAEQATWTCQQEKKNEQLKLQAILATTTATTTTTTTPPTIKAAVISKSSNIDVQSHERTWRYCPRASPRHEMVLNFCPNVTTSEREYQLSFYEKKRNGNALLLRPVTPDCIQLPPPDYKWPGRITEMPAPAGTSGTYWHNLLVNKLEDLKVFNPPSHKNLYHFDAPRYDLEFETKMLFGEKFIPLATKIRLALDVGSGGGSFGLWLKYQYDIQTLSIAFPDWPYCEYITERGNLCIYLNANHAFPFAKFSFDLVHVSWMYHSLEVSKLDAAFRELYRITRPGGYLWMSDGWSQAQVDMMDQLIQILGLVVLYDHRVPHQRETSFGNNPYEVQWWTILLKPIRAVLDPACPATTNTTNIFTSKGNKRTERIIPPE